MTKQLAHTATLPQGAPPTNRPFADVIREDIVEGRFLAGDRLIVADLAKRYGSSSNPVREALHQLQGEGIVVIPPNRGARVRSLGEEFVRNVYELRAVIVPYLVRWFVDNANDDEIAEMEMLCVAIETMEGDLARYRDLNERFHGIVCARHYNTEATGLEIRQRQVLFMLSRRYELTRSRWRAILAEHRGLVEAIKGQDAAAATRVTEQHIRGACEHLIQHIRSEHRRTGA